MVFFDRTMINRYYIDALYRLGTRWDRTSEATIKSFSTKSMDRYSKVWHYFIGAKLLPTINFSVVMKERAMLIHVIQDDKTIDIGLVIQNSSLHGTTASLATLYHILLITMYVKK